MPSRAAATRSSWRPSSGSCPTPAGRASTAARQTSASRSRDCSAAIEDLADDDWRKTNPRFTGENFQRNLRIADEVAAVATEVRATPAQVALAWLLARGDDIAPIPGTKRVARVEENVAADAVELTGEQTARLDNLTPAAGGHHNEAQMQLLER